MRELQYRMPEVIKNGHVLIAPEFEDPLGAGAVYYYALAPKVDVSLYNFKQRAEYSGYQNGMSAESVPAANECKPLVVVRVATGVCSRGRMRLQPRSRHRAERRYDGEGSGTKALGEQADVTVVGYKLVQPELCSRAPRSASSQKSATKMPGNTRRLHKARNE